MKLNNASKKSLSKTATFSKDSIILHKNSKHYKQKNEKIMKMNIASKLSAFILTIQTFVGLSAHEKDQTVDSLKTFPTQLSIVYPLTTMGNQTVDYRFNTSFNLFYGMVGAVKGAEFGGYFNFVKNDMRGAQFGGLGNIAREVNGAQFGGIINISNEVDGAQFAGIANISTDVSGSQFAGMVNVAENVKTQVAGIGNISSEVTGAQIGGIFNITGTLRGVQIGGIVNVTDTVESGVSIALINIVRKGMYREWSLSFADYMNVGVSYKMGMQKFYTVFTAGADFMEDKLWVFGLGVGHIAPISRRIDFQPELIAYQYFPDVFRNVQNVSSYHLKLGFVYKLSDKLGISVAPSVYHFYNDLSKNKDYSRISSIPPIYKHENSRRVHSINAGISVGLRFR